MSVLENGSTTFTFLPIYSFPVAAYRKKSSAYLSIVSEIVKVTHIYYPVPKDQCIV